MRTLENNNEQYQEWDNPPVNNKSRKIRFVILGVIGLLILMAFLFFKSVTYVGSGSFCTICHEMEPFSMTWQQSSHSSITCFQCHFGTVGKITVQPLPVTKKLYWNINLGSTKVNISPLMNKVKGYVVTINKLLDSARVQWTYSKELVKYYRQLAKMMLGGRSNGVEITWKNCASCHANVISKNSKLDSTGHPKHLSAGLACRKCHGDVAHDIVKLKREDCLRCHTSGMPKPKSHLTSVFRDEHGRLYLKRNSCRICHIKGTKEKLCMDCHGVVMPHPKEFTKVHVETIKKTDIRRCINCHREELPPTKTSQGNQNARGTSMIKKSSVKPCATCHGKGFPHQGKTGLAVVNIHTEQIKKLGIGRCFSCHNQQICNDCHGMEVPHPKGFITQHTKLYRTELAQDCVMCHVNGKGTAPKCYDCHGVELPHPTEFLVNHGDQDRSKCVLCHSPKNPVNPRSKIASPAFCIKCHETPRHYDGHWNNPPSSCVSCHFDYSTCSIKCH